MNNSGKTLGFTFGNHTWRFDGGPRIMGILNVTPDSFSDGGEFLDPDTAVERALTMQHDGADIIDVGGESTRPGAPRISLQQELDRVMPVIQRLTGALDIPISIDTQKAAVAAAALAEGVLIINDVSGFHADPDMWRVMENSDAGAVVMHMRGTPETMQQHTEYDNLFDDLCDYFETILARAKTHGIAAARFVLDPGIGFSKTVDQNLALIAHTGRFRDHLGRPMLIGPSRKSFIAKTLNLNPQDDRTWGTAGAVAVAAFNRADILRVHDVKHMRQAARIAAAIATAGNLA